MSPDGRGGPSSVVTTPIEVDDTVGRDHDDAELVGREAERLGDEHPALRLRRQLG